MEERPICSSLSDGNHKVPDKQGKKMDCKVDGGKSYRFKVKWKKIPLIGTLSVSSPIIFLLTETESMRIPVDEHLSPSTSLLGCDRVCCSPASPLIDLDLVLNCVRQQRYHCIACIVLLQVSNLCILELPIYKSWILVCVVFQQGLVDSKLQISLTTSEECN
jgi:hypothetical protein